jgi:predicted nucleotidyltransferase
MAMTLEVVLEKLAGDRGSLVDFGVKSLSVFGSVARGEARSDSDVDLLVEFDRPVGLFHLARLQSHLENLIGARVDLVTPGGLRASMRDRVLHEAVRAA